MGSSVRLEEIANKILPDEAHFHRQSVADLLGRHNINFPGAQPVSFARSHFLELQRTDYYLCEKTDGIRCLMYLAQHVEAGRPPLELQFLIDRKNDYWHVKGGMMHMPLQGELGKFHIGTILDGELVRQTYPDGSSKLMYLIFDCLCMDGRSIMDRTLDIRIGKCEAFIYSPWKELKKAYPDDVAQQPFHLELKKMQLPYAIDFMFGAVLPNLPHGNDGLIFTCKTTPYISGTDQHILKWKPPHENTIDFRLQIVGFPMTEDADGEYEDWDAKPEIELLVNHGDGDYRRYADLYLTDKEWEAMKAQSEMFDHRIVECWLDPELKKWRPKLDDGVPRFRDDKTDANHISTVKSVMESIEDGVTEQDLIAQQGKIREAWKAREGEAKKARDLERQRMQQAHELKEKQRAEAQRQQAAVAAATAAADEDDGPQYSE
nr:hypothetical protein B0A51_18469 [Rachicladosporium sp. CCFEE 5018]